MTVSLFPAVYHDARTSKKIGIFTLKDAGTQFQIVPSLLTIILPHHHSCWLVILQVKTTHTKGEARAWRTLWKNVYFCRNKQKRAKAHVFLWSWKIWLFFWCWERPLFCQPVWWLNRCFLHYFILRASSYFTCLHFFSATVSSNSPSIDRGVCIPPVWLANSPFCLFHPDRGGTMRRQKIKVERNKNQ